MDALPTRFPTSVARQALAARLQLPYSDAMQDWEWEVADASRFPEFVQLYRAGDLSDDEQFSLMEMLVQCVEDLQDHALADSAWSQIEPLLLRKPWLHQSTVIYWACPDEANPEGQFSVSPRMRALLAPIGANPRATAGNGDAQPLRQGDVLRQAAGRPLRRTLGNPQRSKVVNS